MLWFCSTDPLRHNLTSRSTGLQKFLGQILLGKQNKPKGSSDTFLTLFALLEFLFNNPITHGLKLLQQTFSAGSYLLISPGVNQKYHLFVNGCFFFFLLRMFYLIGTVT